MRNKNGYYGITPTVTNGLWEADNVPVIPDHGSTQFVVTTYPAGSDTNGTPSASLNQPVSLPPVVRLIISSMFMNILVFMSFAIIIVSSKPQLQPRRQASRCQTIGLRRISERTCHPAWTHEP